MSIKKYLFTLLFIGTFITLYAQEIPSKTYTTKPIVVEPPDIDGKLTDEAWSFVEWGGDFIGHSPEYNVKPSQETQFKILYDAKYLYVGIRAFDTEPEKIVERMSRRDGFDGDWVEVNIDSYNDKRTAFSFTASVSGVKGDEYISNNGDNWDETWDPIWYLKTSIDDEGWTAEFKIPLSQLRFSKKEELVWGIQFIRRLFRKEEKSTWAPVNPDDAGWVHKFGELRGLRGIKPQNQLEIQPYVVGQVDTYPAVEGDPYRDGTDLTLNAGLDAKVGITSDVTLDLTINPDFGQVEADPSQVNLSALEVFFKERRPFFLEGNNILSFELAGGNNNLFYSRRIGAPPHGSGFYDPINEFADKQPPTRILGAAKLTGKNAKGFSWGILDAFTNMSTIEVTDANDTKRKEKVEPYANYMVARIQQDYNEGNTVLGTAFTNVNRFDNLENGLNTLHNNAQSIGLDFFQNLAQRKYALTVKAAASRVKGSPEAITSTQQSPRRYFQRPDNTYRNVDTTLNVLTGSYANLSFEKISGKWIWGAGGNYLSPGFEVNDVGFLNQTDIINFWASTGYRVNNPTNYARRQEYSLRVENNRDFGWTNLYQWYRANISWQLLNLWEIETGVILDQFYISNDDLRGGPSFRFPRGAYHWWALSTNEQKKFRVSVTPSFYWGSKNFIKSQSFEAGLTYKPSNSFVFSLALGSFTQRFDLQYITTLTGTNGIDKYLKGTLHQQTYGADIRLDYYLTPNLSLQFWGQPFIASGQYSQFKWVANSTSTQVDELYSPISENSLMYSEADGTYYIDEDMNMVNEYSFTNPDFNIVQFRSNLVVRWEYVPGSTLFIVWSNNGSYDNAYTSPHFSNLSEKLFDLKGTNSFLVKFTYRFLL